MSNFAYRKRWTFGFLDFTALDGYCSADAVEMVVGLVGLLDWASFLRVGASRHGLFLSNGTTPACCNL